MTIAYLTPRENRFGNYEYFETIADGATGNTVFIPGLHAGKTISVTIIAGSNSGYYEYSTSLDSEVEDGTSTWTTGDMGTITGTETEVLIANVSAIRCVSVSGQIALEIKI